MSNTDYLNRLKEQLNATDYGDIYSTACIEYATKLVKNNLPVIFDDIHLATLLGLDIQELIHFIFSQDYQYKSISIPKKSGGIREISSPSLELKSFQRWILDNIVKNMHVSEHAYGFLDDISIYDNAHNHINMECVINLDLKDFFPTITQETVFRIFSYYGYTKQVSFFLARLCTYKGVLPQGSPVSPALSNITCLKLDKRLGLLIDKFEGIYSRYADDITISGRKAITNCIPIVEEIITDEKFKINEKKSRIAYKYQRQNVTGLNVNNGKVTIPKIYRNQVKSEIYYCKKYGVDNHLKRIKSDKSFYKEHLYGKVYFINMVNKIEAKKLFEELDSINWDY